MTDTKHTDSAETRFNAKFNTHPYDKAQHIEYKAKEIIKFIKAEIKKANSQQVEEAVKKATKVATIEAWNDAIELSDQLEESNTKFDEWRAFKGFRNGLRDKIRALVETPNHQD